MKTKLLLMLGLVAGLLLTGCSDKDNDMSVEKTYRMYVGQGANSKTGTPAPAITTLDQDVTTAVNQINSGLTEIAVTGKGATEEDALADAERRAIAVYDLRAENVIASLISIKATFEVNRALSAAEILTETGYYTKLTLQLFLVEKTGDFQDPIIKQSTSYYMEAIGGEDYSPAN